MAIGSPQLVTPPREHDAIEGDPRVVNEKLCYVGRDRTKRRVCFGGELSKKYDHVFSLHVDEAAGAIRFGARRGRTFCLVELALADIPMSRAA